MCFGLRDATAQGTTHIRLKGSAHLDVHAARAAGKLVLSGTVIDDATHPVPSARVGITFARSADLGTPIALSAASPEACDGFEAPELDRADRLVLTADDVGHFCIRLAVATDRYVARIEAETTGLIDGSNVDLPLDLAVAPVTLRFDPAMSVVLLDDDRTSLDVVASTEEDEVTVPAADLALSLSNEENTPLGSATTDPSGRARFVIEGVRLGAPGKGELRVKFSGNGRAGAVTHTVRIERRTGVDVVAPDARAGRLPVAWPEDGIALRLVATSRCAQRGCRGSPTGTVEARVDGYGMVGAAPLDRGETRLVLAFMAPNDAYAAPTPSARARAGAAGDVGLTLRYVPDAPWFLPAGELALLQPLRGPNPWKKVPLVLAAAAVVAWLALARLPVRARTKRKATRLTQPAHLGQQVQLVRAGPTSQGWSGHVADAHDRVAIAHARVAIERPGFERVEVVAETSSDAVGAFALAPIEARPGDELVATGQLHALLRRPLPPSGELAVALVLRKRALLDRLVAWARRRGAPYDALPDPTPGHVRRAAGSDAAVTRWANALEQAAYGGAVVDELAQAEVDRLAPDELA